MQKKSISESGLFNPRIFFAFVLCLTGTLLALIGFATSTPPPSQATGQNIPTFGHPIISGIGGVGFEQDIRLDPSNPNLVYTSAPGSLSSDTSWIWHSRDGGKTFKWITAGTPLQGKATACGGGGDSELGVDAAGRLYFNDLTLANFSVGRSDDGGVTFPCNNTGVPDTAVDRQWYATDGDAVNGGNIYLANDEIGPGGAMCGGSTGNNVLVMYRSPVNGVGSTAGLQFGPANHVTADLSCDEAIMGNNEVSPIATTTGKLNPGPTTLPAPVKHVYVIHDNATLDQIQIGRCFPVAFGPPIPNVSDPSGLNCDNLPVASFPGFKTGANFATMAIDKAGNLYAVWSQAPIDGSGNVTGDTVLKYSYSTNEGNTWSTPMQIDTSGSSAGTLHNNVFVWMAAGDDSRVDIAWYGTPGIASGTAGPDSCTTCNWSLWMVQTLNGHSATPTFSAPILASEHFMHHGSIQTLIGGQTGDRTLGDFLQVRMGPNGEAQIGYADSNNIDEAFAPHGMYVRQNGGEGLIVSSSPVNIPGLTPFNTVSDPTGDAKYEVSGTTSANMPQLDIINSSVAQVTTAPCSVAAPCYKVVMQLNNLSLAPTTAQDPDPDLVWLTQWLVPSTSDPNGGKNFFVYAESTGGGALTCYYGENAASAVGGGVTLTYPGAAALPAANCQSTLGPNGTITIYVPLANVNEPGAIDNRLHEVTASTMTLEQPANAVPSVGGIGGVLFNLIDVAQGYTFIPNLVTTPTPTPSATATGTATATPTATATAAATATATATVAATATPSATATATPGVSISGNILYCSNPSPGPVPNVTLTLTGSASGSTLSDASGNYTFSVPSGGTYTVTPSKAARVPGSPNINTVDVIATQRHFLQLGTPLTGCRLTAADVNGDSSVNTIDVVAIQRFFLGLSTGIANVGKYKFIPANRTYTGLTTNQTGQNYDALVFGDVASSFVELADGSSQTEADDSTSAGKAVGVALQEVAVDQLRTPKAFASGVLLRVQSMSNFIAGLVGFQDVRIASAQGSGTIIPVVPQGDSTITVSLPMASFDTLVPSTTVIIQPVMTTLIDPTTTNGLNYIAFQGDFTFDSAVATFQSPFTEPAGLTGTNWNVSGNVLNTGPGTTKTLRISAFSLDFTPLNGSGTLLNLRMLRVSNIAGATSPLIWRPAPDNFFFIDDNLDTHTPNQPPGLITITGAATPTPHGTPTPHPPHPTPTPHMTATPTPHVTPTPHSPHATPTPTPHRATPTPTPR